MVPRGGSEIRTKVADEGTEDALAPGWLWTVSFGDLKYPGAGKNQGRNGDSGRKRDSGHT